MQRIYYFLDMLVLQYRPKVEENEVTE
ncbi:hypothetical protein EYZ11_003292 [Aspergillus tanneri]|uniref:Uncharacterized protein n=1 Tax=Aspergillus tanneri TaxID=1220188 RepID=A0A4S3JNJ4_9EURO|nr:hypothetical protein EYZ11_003292 [Aspergillus tanneri]